MNTFLIYLFRPSTPTRGYQRVSLLLPSILSVPCNFLRILTSYYVIFYFPHRIRKFFKFLFYALGLFEAEKESLISFFLFYFSFFVSRVAVPGLLPLLLHLYNLNTFRSFLCLPTSSSLTQTLINLAYQSLSLISAHISHK